MKKSRILTLNRRQESGAAALEYILVSTFAAVVTIAALSYVARLVKSEVNKINSKLGGDAAATEFDFDFAP
jgi:Flp pilus assembly pilin Flp